MARTKEFDQTRALDKALEVFWRKGYTATSIQDLVAHMGINRQSIYDTFGDKHRLFIAALQRYRQQTRPSMAQVFATTESPLAAIQQILTGMVDEAMADPHHRGCFMNNSTVELAPHDPETACVVQENGEEVQRMFQEAILRAQELGEIAADRDATALARFLLSSIQGLRVMSKMTNDRAVLQDIVDVTMSALFR